MQDDHTATGAGVTRRNALLGLGAAAGAAAVVNAVPFKASAGGLVSILAQDAGADLGAAIPGLTYIGLDALAFLPDLPEDRVYSTASGTQPATTPSRIWAPLSIPSGSVVYQFNAGYYGQPIAEINRRSIAQPFPAQAPAAVFQATLPAAANNTSTTVNLTTPVTIEPNSTYTVAFRCNAAQSVFGCSIGYLPPTQSFVPFTGTPRILDTRSSTKLAPGEERIIDLGIPGARTAVINLTITRTVGAGFVAVFPADIAWPGNSSINWSGPDQNIANGVITKVDATGKIKIRGGDGSTDVIIDRTGYMI